MNKEQNNPIDELFRKSLGDYEREGSAILWAKMEQRLDSANNTKKKGLIPVYFWPGLAAASVLFAVGIFASFFVLRRQSGQIQMAINHPQKVVNQPNTPISGPEIKAKKSGKSTITPQRKENNESAKPNMGKGQGNFKISTLKTDNIAQNSTKPVKTKLLDESNDGVNLLEVQNLSPNLNPPIDSSEQEVLVSVEVEIKPGVEIMDTILTEKPKLAKQSVLKRLIAKFQKLKELPSTETQPKEELMAFLLGSRNQ